MYRKGVRLPQGAFQVQPRGQRSKTDNVLLVNHTDLLRKLQTQRYVRVGDLDVCGGEGSLGWSFGC